MLSLVTEPARNSDSWRKWGYRFPLRSCSISKASKRALKFPFPKLWLPRRKAVSKNRRTPGVCRAQIPLRSYPHAKHIPRSN